MYNKCLSIIIHHDQQIVLRKTRNLELCFGTNVGTKLAKIQVEKISICRAILLGFLRSLVSAIQYEANKSSRRREEKPIGSHAFKILRDLWRHARGLAQHVAAANACAEVRARMHNWLIWCQGSSRIISCVMARSNMRLARGEQNSTRGGGNLDNSVDSAQILVFTR